MPGSVGWQAPEAIGADAATLLGGTKVILERESEGDVSTGEIEEKERSGNIISSSPSSNGSVVESTGTTGTNSSGGSLGRTSQFYPRCTRAVDVFSLGCLLHYILTGGAHPFGEWYEVWKSWKICHAKERKREEERVKEREREREKERGRDRGRQKGRRKIDLFYLDFRLIFASLFQQNKNHQPTERNIKKMKMMIIKL